MSKKILYPFFDSLVDSNTVFQLCYPTPKINWVQVMLRRGHSVDYIINTTAEKEAFKGKRLGQKRSKKVNRILGNG